MARVTVLTHSHFVHKRTKTLFREQLTTLGDGSRVFLGVADVPDDVAREHFVGHPAFRVEGLSDVVAASTNPAHESDPSPDTRTTSRPEPTPDANGAPAGGASEGVDPRFLKLEAEAIASLDYPALKAMAKANKLDIGANPSKAALIAALTATLAAK